MKSSDDAQSTSSGTHISSIERPTAKYSRLSNTVRQITPGPWQCAMFCGGKNCKYDNPARWSESEMALKGLYSSWVGDNILAIARPSSEAIEKYRVVDQFKQHGIKSLINLQRPGEHSSCGNPLQSSGFSYEPQQFMDNNIFFYNFGWDDYGVRSLPSILDMVKVMSFALQQGKVAVHCHAGLGRTGVLIACYLIYEQRMEGDNAIQFVREKRIGSIQTPGQIECCQQFAKFLIPFRVIFSSCDPCAFPFTLDQFLIRQTMMLHGYEARELKYLPKIVRVVCNQLAQLAYCSATTAADQTGETMDLLRKTAPSAFPSQRPAGQPSQRNKHRAAASSSSGGKLPPLRRSSSAEDLHTAGEAAALGSQASLEVPHQAHGLPPQPPPRAGHASPMLDTRRHMLDSGLTSGSDDDHCSNAGEPPRRRPLPPPSQLSQSARFAGNGRAGLKPALAAHRGSLTASLNRSVLLLSSLLIDDPQEADDAQLVGTAMAFDPASSDMDPAELQRLLQSLNLRVDSLQHNLNRSATAWRIVMTEEDPYVLSALMWSWLDHLQKPILSKADIAKLQADHDEDDPSAAFKSLSRGAKHTLDCILKTVSKLDLRPNLPELEDAILIRLTKAVTHLPATQLLSQGGPKKTAEVEGEEEEEEEEEDSEGQDLARLLTILRTYVECMRPSCAEDTLSLSSQDSGLLSLGGSLKLAGAGRPSARGSSGRVRGATVDVPLGGGGGGRPKTSPRALTPSSTDTADSVRPRSPRDGDGRSASTSPQPPAALPAEALQRRKLKALDKLPAAKGVANCNQDGAAPSLPRKNALPPIF